MRNPLRRLLACTATIALLLAATPSASAADFGSRTLSRGASGDDVREVQIRAAGWYDNCAGVPCDSHFGLDANFGAMTDRTVRNFQKAYNLTVDGVVGPNTFAALERLEDPDQSSVSFNWSEFYEKSGECSTNNKGTFNGGKVPALTVRENARRVMYRLEVVKAKMDNKYPVYVWSGYRSMAYNDCLKSKHGKSVATNSQHMYGTAYDGSMARVDQGKFRGLAKTSQFHGIFCYSGGDNHNHFDIRSDNSTSGGGFTWPATDSQGRDITSGGNVCAGGYKSPPSTGTKPPAVGVALDTAVSGIEIGPVSDPEGETKQATSEEIWLGDDSE